MTTPVSVTTPPLAVPPTGQKNWDAAADALFVQLNSRKVEKATLSLDIRDQNAACDGRRIAGVTTNGTTLTAVGAGFSAADYQKWVIVFDANADGGGSAVPQQIVSVQSTTQVTLSGSTGQTLNGSATCYGIVWTDDGPEIQQTLNAAAALLTPGPDLTTGPNQSQGAGMIVVRIPAGAAGYTGTRQQLSVPPGVVLHMEGFLVNGMADRFAPCVVFQRYTGFGDILVEVAYGAGVQMGTATQTQANIRGNTIVLWHVSRAPETGGAQRRCIGIAVYGQDYQINLIWMKNADIGIYGNEASDFMCRQAMLIGVRQPALIMNSNQFYCRFTLDTCGQDGGGISGVVFDNNCSDFSCDIQAFEVVGVTHVMDYVLDVGPTSANACQNFRANVQAQRTGGGCVRLNYAKDFTVDAHASNSVVGATGGSNMTSGVTYGANCAGIGYVRLSSDENIAAPDVGAPWGGLLVQRGNRSLTVQSGFATTGATYLGVLAAAPNDTFIANGQMIPWADQANGQLRWRVRFPDGTYKTASVALA